MVKVIHERKYFIDHCPLTIEFNTDGWKQSIPNQKPFKFEEMWMREANCEQIIEMAWKKNEDALRNIVSVKEALKGFDLLNIKKIHKRITELED